MGEQQTKRKFKKYTKIVLGETDTDRRNNLLTNASYGYVTKAEQRGNDVFIRVGSEDFEIVDYLILNAKLEIKF